MTDEHNPPAEPDGEPEPGTTEWLLAQLSGGRIASRRERREAEAALATAGVQLPDGDAPAEASATETPSLPEAAPTAIPSAPEAADQPAGDDAAEERPKARFSWETGMLQVVTPVESESESAAESTESESAEVTPAAPAEQPSGDEAPEPPLADETAAQREPWAVSAPAVTESEAAESHTADADADAESAAVEPAAPEPVEPERAAAPEPSASAPALTFDTTLLEPESDEATPDETPHAFLWQLAPSDEADPALNPGVELPLPAEPEAAPFVIPAAAPLVVPKPVALPEPPADVESVGAAEPVEPEVPAAPAAPEPAAPAEPTELSPFDALLAPQQRSAEPALPVAPAFVTPVPSEDEFTLHDTDGSDAPEATAAPEAADAEGEPTQLIDAPDFFEKALAAEEPTQLIDTVPGFVEAVPAFPVDEAPSDETPIEEIPTEEMQIAGADAASQQPGEQAAEGEPGSETGAHVTSDWSDIADMLGANPATVENSIVPQWPPVDGAFDALTQFVAPNAAGPGADAIATAAPAAIAVQPVGYAVQPADGGPAGPAGPRRSGAFGRNRWLLLIVLVLAAVLVGIALFALGRALAHRGDTTPTAAKTPVATHTTPPASPTSSPTPTVDIPATGPLPVGQTYAWDELRGGECINPFSGAWAQEFAIVDCTAQHGAQLVYTAPYSADPAAPFPGQNEISSQINLLCSKPGVIDMTAAAAYTDLQVVASYPVTQDQWDNGQRNFYCFVTRSSGQPLSSSVAGAGPAAQ